MKTHSQEIAIVVTPTKATDLPGGFVRATKIHWEMVDVVDFYAQGTANPPRASRKKREEEAVARAIISRARTHLEQKP